MNSSGMGVIPAGGWKFAQRLPNGNFHWFFSTTKDDLVKQIVTFRASAGLDAGDPFTEVANQISGATHKKPSDQRSLRERVTAWKANRQFGPVTTVSQEVAEERAAICASCPFNLTNYADACIECYRGTERDLYAMRQGRTTSQDDKLGACNICGHDNKTAAIMDESLLKHRVRYKAELEEKYPACWLLRLDQNTDKEVA